jgi:hypothetical protein
MASIVLKTDASWLTPIIFAILIDIVLIVILYKLLLIKKNIRIKMLIKRKICMIQ